MECPTEPLNLAHVAIIPTTPPLRMNRNSIGEHRKKEADKPKTDLPKIVASHAPSPLTGLEYLSRQRGKGEERLQNSVHDRGISVVLEGGVGSLTVDESCTLLQTVASFRDDA